VLDGEGVEDEGASEPRLPDVTQFESPDDAPTIKLVRSIVSEAGRSRRVRRSTSRPMTGRSLCVFESTA